MNKLTSSHSLWYMIWAQGTGTPCPIASAVALVLGLSGLHNSLVEGLPNPLNLAENGRGSAVIVIRKVIEERQGQMRSSFSGSFSLVDVDRSSSFRHMGQAPASSGKN